MATKKNTMNINDKTFKELCAIPVKRYGELSKADRLKLLWMDRPDLIEKVKNYVATNKTIPHDKAPKVILHWDYSKKKVKYYKYFNTYNGEIWAHEEPGRISLYTPDASTKQKVFDEWGYNRENWSIYTVRPIDGWYTNYIPELNALEISHIYMHGTRNTENFEGWVYTSNRYFWFLDTVNPVAYNVLNGDTYMYECETCKDDYYSKSFEKNVIQQIRNIGWYQHDSTFKTVINVLSNGEVNECEDLHYYAYDLARAYKIHCGRSISKNYIDLTALPLPDHKIKFEDFPTRSVNYYYANDRAYQMTIVDVLKESGYAVFRTYCREYNCTHGHMPEENKIYEGFRFYVDSNGKATALVNCKSQYGRIIGPECWQVAGSYNSTYTTPVIDAKYFKVLEAHPTLKYVVKYLKGTKNKNDSIRLEDIVTTVRNPFMEKILNAGYTNLLCELVRCGRDVKASIRYTFDGNPTKSGLYDVFNMNKYGLQWVNNACKNAHQFSLNCKFIRTVEELSDMDVRKMDKKAVEEWFPIANAMSKTFRDYYVQLITNPGSTYYYYYRQQRDKITLTPEQRKMITPLIKLMRKDPSVCGAYRDALNLLYRIPAEQRGNFDFSTINDMAQLHRMHNGLVAVYNEYQTQMRTERDKKLAEMAKYRYDNRVKKYEDIGEKLSVIVPKNVTELVVEGNQLRHCVGGYTERFAAGNTDILFVRRNDCPNVPFYTMEISNGHVVQIHGFGNKWAGNDPDVARYLYKYLNARGISYIRDVLVSKSTGYSHNSMEGELSWEEVTK